MNNAAILTLNSGSSSIKTAVYHMGAREQLLLSGQLEGIGQGAGRFKMTDADGKKLIDQTASLPDHVAALTTLFDWLQSQSEGGAVNAVGHRIVHGGPRFTAPQRITRELTAEVRRLVPFDPLHLPSELAAVEAVDRLFPHVAQVACFDTAFHATMPTVAKMFALPRQLFADGIHRYGFHGLSYEYIVEELRRLDPRAAAGRVVIAHLGSGASMAAVRDGRCVDTTMGFTPTGGLVMATRCGDLDPGVLLYLLAERRMSAEALNHLVNHESGLLGLSGISADMRTLVDQSATRPEAEQAVAGFCYQARKFIGAFAAALGGIDTLIFTAGIGERSAPIRSRVCTGLDWLGVDFDAARNAAGNDVISRDGSRVTVRVIPTNEELMIARHTHRTVGGSQAASG